MYTSDLNKISFSLHGKVFTFNTDLLPARTGIPKQAFQKFWKFQQMCRCSGKFWNVWSTKQSLFGTMAWVVMAHSKKAEQWTPPKAVDQNWSQQKCDPPKIEWLVQMIHTVCSIPGTGVQNEMWCTWQCRINPMDQRKGVHSVVDQPTSVQCTVYTVLGTKQGSSSKSRCPVSNSAHRVKDASWNRQENGKIGISGSLFVSMQSLNEANHTCKHKHFCITLQNSLQIVTRFDILRRTNIIICICIIANFPFQIWINTYSFADLNLHKRRSFAHLRKTFQITTNLRWLHKTHLFTVLYSHKTHLFADLWIPSRHFKLICVCKKLWIVAKHFKLPPCLFLCRHH